MGVKNTLQVTSSQENCNLLPSLTYCRQTVEACWCSLITSMLKIVWLSHYLLSAVIIDFESVYDICRKYTNFWLKTTEDSHQPHQDRARIHDIKEWCSMAVGVNNWLRGTKTCPLSIHSALSMLLICNFSFLFIASPQQTSAAPVSLQTSSTDLPINHPLHFYVIRE